MVSCFNDRRLLQILPMSAGEEVSCAPLLVGNFLRPMFRALVNAFVVHDWNINVPCALDTPRIPCRGIHGLRHAVSRNAFL